MVVLGAQGLLGGIADEDQLGIVRNAFWIGGLFILSITAYLGWRLKLLKDATRAQISTVANSQR